MPSSAPPQPGPTRVARSRPRPASAPEPLAWRLLRDGPASGARNMAVDEALARCLRDGHGVVRLYRWARPTVSFGRNEPTRSLYSIPTDRRTGLAWVRRPTGGRAVLHAGEITYAVAAPARALGGARAAYRAISGALASALRSLGVAAEVVAEAPTLPPDAGPCFVRPAAGEVVVGGRKLVGSAQARVGGALLQHGSILVSNDQSGFSELAGAQGPGGVAAATLQQLLGVVDERCIEEAVARAFAEALGGRWSEGALGETERGEADRLEEERYGRDSWTWRR